MEPEKMIAENSEVVEEAAEELANSGSSIMETAAVFGTGVLAGVILCKIGVPYIARKFKERRRKKYVTITPSDENSEVEAKPNVVPGEDDNE